MKEKSFISHEPFFIGSIWKTIFAIFLVWVIALVVIFPDPKIEVKVIYFACVLSYLMIGNQFNQIVDEVNIFDFPGKFFYFLLIFNLIFIGLSVVGYILHFFIHFPPPFSEIFCWPSIISICIFSVATGWGFSLWKDCKKEYFDLLTY